MRGSGIKTVILDPGVGFSIRNVLLFAAGNNPLGLYACLVAALATVAVKLLAVANPRALPVRVLDPRMTLWIISAALLLTAAGALLQGEFLAAMAGVLFATGNVRIAESLSTAGRGESGLLSLLFKRPDIYLNAGTAVACLMAGQAALWVLPLIFVSTLITLYNAWFEKPEYSGYPKTIIAAATLTSAGIAFANAGILIGFSHILGAAILFGVERRLVRTSSRG